MKAGDLKRDFHGLMLCLHCFNNAHYIHKTNKITGKKTSTLLENCLQGGCECPCRELLAEKRRKLAEKRHQDLGPSPSPTKKKGANDHHKSRVGAH